MKLLSVTPRTFVRGFTATAAVVCGLAVTVIVHDAPAASAEGARESVAQAWKQQVVRGERSVATSRARRARLRVTYNQLVRSSIARLAVSAR